MDEAHELAKDMWSKMSDTSEDDDVDDALLWYDDDDDDGDGDDDNAEAFEGTASLSDCARQKSRQRWHDNVWWASATDEWPSMATHRFVQKAGFGIKGGARWMMTDRVRLWVGSLLELAIPQRKMATCMPERLRSTSTPRDVRAHK